LRRFAAKYPQFPQGWGKISRKTDAHPLEVACVLLVKDIVLHSDDLASIRAYSAESRQSGVSFVSRLLSFSMYLLKVKELVPVNEVEEIQILIERLFFVHQTIHSGEVPA
jgi:hypothetical protein